MKTVLILRHAKSSWEFDNLADHDRPLKNRGKQDAEKMGNFILKKGLVPQCIISSTAARARKTAQLVADACDYDADIELDASLYNASPENIRRLLRRLDDSIGRVMLVGHNPCMEELIEELIEELTESPVSLPTCALAHIDLPVSSWSEVNIASEGNLVDLWVPRQL